MLNDKEIELVKRGNIIGAISSLRQRTPGLGLREARAACNAAVPMEQRAVESYVLDKVDRDEQLYAPATYAGGREGMKEELLKMLLQERDASRYDSNAYELLCFLIKRVEKMK